MSTTPATASTRFPDKTRADLPTQLRRENAQLREQLAKLAALVDHFYGAYREAQNLLARREREIGELRRKLDCAGAPPSVILSPDVKVDGETLGCVYVTSASGRHFLARRVSQRLK